MHWWQGPFTSSSKSNSYDDSVIIGHGASRYSLKHGYFSSRRNRKLTRARKLRHVTRDEVEAWRLRSHSENSQASPQPLPLPNLQVLLQRDPKFSASSSYGVSLPSPDAIRNQRGGCEEKERERDRERQIAEELSADVIDAPSGLKRLVDEETWMNVRHSETHSLRKSPTTQNAKDRSSDNCYINITSIAPASPYSSLVLSPPKSDILATHYITPPSLLHVWSEPEMPHSDENLGQSLFYPVPSEKIASSVVNSSLQSPSVSSSLHATSLPMPASPLPTKISSETPVARGVNSAQATVHPLPLPPGAGMPSQSTPISPAASTSDFSGAFVPSQSTPISIIAAKPELPGANILAQGSNISQVAGKPELMPIKSQWQKGKLIGRGTFGSVYVASNRQTGALCAMKEVEILPDDSKSAESMKQLEQEIKVLSNLKHPNIVQYYGSEIVGDKFYIYLEYVHPGSINKFIHDHCGAITESVVRNFTRHILSGLAYLHSTKTIHRDIKGANLLVDAYGVVKLADFGMAKHLNGQVADLSLKGSPYWLAPELLQSVMQTDGSSDLALAVDIWSLGCTIIEMMNGKPPWSEYEGAAALFKVLKETPSIPETLSADGKDFLECCFRRNPADRPTAGKLLDHPFVNYLHQPDVCIESLTEIKLKDDKRSREGV